jgi:hypothetical protein
MQRPPCMMTPCCGTWSRFNFALWGPDGYRCLMCSLTRGTGCILPDVCGVCGQSSMAPEWSRGVQGSCDARDATGAPRTNAELAAVSSTIASRPTIEPMFETTLGVDGLTVPSSAEFAKVIVVIDDDVSGLIIPIGVCRRCYAVANSARLLVAAPRLLSSLRLTVATSQITKEATHMQYMNRPRDNYGGWCNKN